MGDRHGEMPSGPWMGRYQVPLDLGGSTGLQGRGKFVFIRLDIFFFLLNLNLFILIRGQLLYNIVLVLPYINMNLPRCTRVPNPVTVGTDLSGLAEAEFVRLLRGKVDLPTPLATLHSLEGSQHVQPTLKGWELFFLALRAQ